MTRPRTIPQDSNPLSLCVIWVILVVYFALNALTQHLASPTVELDQSEQMLLSQEFMWGYARQPPLYTWLVRGVFCLTGPSLAALLAVKVAILGLLAATWLRTGKEFAFSREQYIVALVGMAFIPQVIWESQRDLTHSPLAALLAGAGLLQVARLQRSPRIHHYILLGLLVGLGLLSKYNDALFLVGLVAAVALTPQYRSVIFRPALVWSMAVAAVVAAPHFVWALGHMDVSTGGMEKLDLVAGKSLEGLGHLFFAAAAFGAPLVLLAVFVMKRGSSLPEAQAHHRLLLSRLLIMVFVVTALFVLASGAQNMKDRWFQPLLFFLPLLLALYSAISRDAARRVCVIGIIIAAGVAVALPGRLVLAGHMGWIKRPNTPFRSLGTDLAPLIEKPSVVVAEKRFIGGNMRAVFPEAVIVTPDTPMPTRIPSGPWLILCEDLRDEPFKAWLRSRLDLDPAALEFKPITKPYYYAGDKPYTLWYATLFRMTSGVNTPSRSSSDGSTLPGSCNARSSRRAPCPIAAAP